MQTLDKKKKSVAQNEDYYFENIEVKVKCNLSEHRAIYDQTLNLVKLKKNDIVHNFDFETDSNCTDLELKLLSHTNYSFGKNDYYYDGPNYYKSVEMSIDDKIPINEPIKISLKFSRAIEIESFDGFFNLSRNIVGLFYSSRKECKHFRQIVEFEDSEILPINIIRGMSSAKYRIFKNGKSIMFVRSNIPVNRLIPITIIVEKGDIKIAQNKFQLKWTLLGGGIGLMSSLIIVLLKMIFNF